ncbi:MAG: type II toxin-antitoxin system VapC family toxin [Anaerolineaceae bacterium]
MRLLLDSNVFLWSGSTPNRISTLARVALADPNNELLLSSVSPWEAGIKIATGRLVLPSALPDFTRNVLSDLKLVELPVSIAHALKSAELPLIHGDPFDRILVAQALIEGVPIVSSDRRLSEYGVAVIW